MIHWLTINFIIPATPSNPSSNPTFSTSKFVHHEQWCLGDVDENTMMVHMLFFSSQDDGLTYISCFFPTTSQFSLWKHAGVLPSKWDTVWMGWKHIFRLIIHNYYIYICIYIYIYSYIWISMFHLWTYCTQTVWNSSREICSNPKRRWSHSWMDMGHGRYWDTVLRPMELVN